MEPFVSVIVPTYNNEKTIERCIRSIKDQTLKEIEIIVVNDGSTDSTAEILDNIAKWDTRIRIIHKHNEGQGVSRNIGLQLAKGKYIGFVDGDDTIDANMYRKMLDKGNDYDADVVQCNILDVFEDGRQVIQLPPFNQVASITDRKQYFDDYVFSAKHSSECCNKLIKKRFLIENTISFENNSKVYAEDLLFNLDMALCIGKIVFMGDLFYHYYQYPYSHSKNSSIDKVLKLCDLFELFAHKAPELKMQISKIAVLIIMINLSHILHTKEGYEAAKTFIIRKDIKKYLFLSFLSMKRWRHKLIMLCILYMPIRVKLFIVQFYYTHLR